MYSSLYSNCIENNDYIYVNPHEYWRRISYIIYHHFQHIPAIIVEGQPGQIASRADIQEQMNMYPPMDNLVI